MDIIFEEPSQAALLRARPGRYVEFCIALREHPKKWAVVPETTGPRTPGAAMSLAQNIRRGITSGFTKGEWDSVADGGKVYAMYLGPAEEQPEEPDKPVVEGGHSGLRVVLGDVQDRVSTHIVRQWAKDNHYEVTDRGRLPDEVWAAYEAAHAPSGTR